MAGTKRLYDWFVEKLNENSYGVKFSGNFIFKFWQQSTSGVSDFEILQVNEESLDYDVVELVPVVDVQTIEIPFVEKNERSDYEKEFYVALRIKDSLDPETNELKIEFDPTDEKYLALQETINSIKSQLSFTYDGYRHTVKAKEPQKVQTFKNNGKYYTLFGITMNISTIKSGYFGNEMAFYLYPTTQTTYNETDRLDIVDASIIVAKQTEIFNELNMQPVEQTTKIGSRNFSIQITANYRGSSYNADDLLWQELIASNTNTIKKQYKVRIIQDVTNEEKIMVITSMNAEFRNNSVEKITFQLERV